MDGCGNCLDWLEENGVEWNACVGCMDSESPTYNSDATVEATPDLFPHRQCRSEAPPFQCLDYQGEPTGGAEDTCTVDYVGYRYGSITGGAIGTIGQTSQCGELTLLPAGWEVAPGSLCLADGDTHHDKCGFYDPAELTAGVDLLDTVWPLACNQPDMVGNPNTIVCPDAFRHEVLLSAFGGQCMVLADGNSWFTGTDANTCGSNELRSEAVGPYTAYGVPECEYWPGNVLIRRPLQK